MAAEANLEQPPENVEATDAMSEQQSLYSVQSDTPEAAFDVSPESADAAEDSGVTEEVASVDDSGIDDDLAELASSYGLNPAKLGSRDNVEYAIAVLDRQASQLYQQFQQQPEQVQQQDPAAMPQVPSALDIKKLLVESFGGEEYEPAVEKVVAGLHSHWTQQLAPYQQVMQHLPALAQEVVSMRQFVQQEQDRQSRAEIDTFFTGLGDEWSEMFGKQPLDKLPSHSPHLQQRSALIDEARTIAELDARRGRPPSSRQQLLKRALYSLHGDKTEANARKQVIDKLKANKNRAVSRPGNKTGQPVDGIQRAVQRSQQWFAQRGMTVPVLSEDE